MDHAAVIETGGRGAFRGLCWRPAGRRTGATENKPKIAYVHPILDPSLPADNSP